MRFWSKGLGERELVIDLSRGNLTREEGKVFILGIVKEPVAWNYEVTLFGEDVGGLLRVIVSVAGIVYFLKNITGVFTFISRLGKMGSKAAETKKAKTKPSESTGS